MYRVMIVEDDPMVADIDRQYVEMDRAFQVIRICKDGAEGLEYLRQNNNVDLIILDYYTPAMTGTEFVDRLHAMGKAPAIIMVTSANDTCIVQGLLARGVMDYLVKPFQHARFQQALDRFAQSNQVMSKDTDHLNQSSIDLLFQRGAAAHAANVPQLAKGLNAGTLERVRQFFQNHPNESFTSEQVAEHLGLSRITIRHYVGYMADKHEIESSIDYQTGGRPAVRYSLKSA